MKQICREDQLILKYYHYTTLINNNLCSFIIILFIKFFISFVFLMDYDLDSVEFKIDTNASEIRETGENRISRCAPSIDIKEVVERFRRSKIASQEERLKIKLSEAYDKLSKEIKLNNEYEIVIQELENRLNEQREENKKVGEIMSNIIENRKHLEKECQKLRIGADLSNSMKNELTRAKQQLKRVKGQLSRNEETYKTLQNDYKTLKSTFESKIRVVKEENVRFENQKIRLERLMIEKDQEINRLRQENKRLSYLHLENSNLLKTIELIKPSPSENSLNLNIDGQKSYGKWKKTTTTTNNVVQKIGKTSNEYNRELIFENKVQTNDQKLTEQLKKKKKIQDQLNRLSNMKKLSPQEHKQLQNLQKILYEVNSNVSSLKRKIRHCY